MTPEYRWNGSPTPPKLSKTPIMDRYKNRPEERRTVEAAAKAWERLKAMSR